MNKNNLHIFDKINVGDLIFTRTDSFTGKVIRFFTRSEINHVAIYIGHGVVAESEIGVGVRHYPLMNYVHDPKVLVYLGTLKGVPENTINKAIAIADSKLESPYDFLGQFGILFKMMILRLGLGWLVKFYGRNIMQSDRAWWCSELVAFAYEKAGLKLTQSDQRYATPEDLAVSDYIEFKSLR